VPGEPGLIPANLYLGYDKPGFRCPDKNSALEVGDRERRDLDLSSVLELLNVMIDKHSLN